MADTERLRRIALGTLIGSFGTAISECKLPQLPKPRRCILSRNKPSLCRFFFVKITTKSRFTLFVVIFFGWVISRNTVISNSQSLITIISRSSSFSRVRKNHDLITPERVLKTILGFKVLYRAIPFPELFPISKRKTRMSLKTSKSPKPQSSPSEL